jgi:hypothetical protein
MISDSQTGSSFSGAAGYIASKAEGEEEDWATWAKRQAGIEEKVQAVQTRNLLMDDDPKMAAEEMRVTANRNDRVEKPRYSISLSYHPDDSPSDEEMMRDMDDFLDRRGLSEHQAILAIHRDKDHDHIHATINRVHPQTGNLWRDSFDYFENMDALRKIEQKRGWTQPQRDESRGRMPDWKIRRFQRTGELPFSQEVLSAAGDDFDQAISWEDLQKRLADKGLQVVEKGSGGVVTDGKEESPLSELARKWSFNKLDSKFPDQFQTYNYDRTERQNRPGGEEKKRAEGRAERDQERDQQPQKGSQKDKGKNGRDQKGDDRGGRGTESDAEDRRETGHNARGLAGRSNDREKGRPNIRREGSSSEADRESRERGRGYGREDQGSGSKTDRKAFDRERDLPSYSDVDPLDWRDAEILGDSDEIEKIEHIEGEGMITVPEKLTDKGQIVSRELAQGNKIEAAKVWEKMKEEKQKHDWKRLSKNDKIRLNEAIEKLENHKNQKSQSQSQDRDRGNNQDKGQGRDRGGKGRER